VPLRHESALPFLTVAGEPQEASVLIAWGAPGTELGSAPVQRSAVAPAV